MVAAARPLRVPGARPPARLDARHAARCCSPRFRVRRNCIRRRISGRSRSWPRPSRSSARARTSCSTRIAAKSCPTSSSGLGNAIHVNAYRISSLMPGALALILADHLPWSQRLLGHARLFMLPGIAMTLVVDEPELRRPGPRTLRRSGVEPFREFISRDGWSRRCSCCFHLPLQAGRQHGHRARHAVLSRHGLHASRRSASSPRTRASGRASSAACWAASGC